MTGAPQRRYGLGKTEYLEESVTTQAGQPRRLGRKRKIKLVFRVCWGGVKDFELVSHGSCIRGVYIHSYVIRGNVACLSSGSDMWRGSAHFSLLFYTLNYKLNREGIVKSKAGRPGEAVGKAVLRPGLELCGNTGSFGGTGSQATTLEAMLREEEGW